MEGKKLLRYSLQLSMLNQLFNKKMISESEYKIIENDLKKDYRVVSNITT